MTYASKYKTFKAKTGRCGHRFTPTRQFQPNCPACEGKIFKGTFESDEDLVKMSFPMLKQLAKGVFDTYIRERDKEKGCINGDHKIVKAYPMQAGHILKCEVYPGLMFDENNCFGQCSMHNNRMNEPAIEAEARLGAMKRIGDAEYANLMLKEMLSSSRNPKYSRIELSNLIPLYRGKSEEMKSKK